MSVSLSRRDGRFDLSHAAWACCLAAAQYHGWEPAGTEPCIELLRLYAEEEDDPEAMVEEWAAEWDGNYSTNDGQVITAKDATAMADALEVANEDEPAVDLREMIEFLRGGSCAIY